MGTVRCLWVLLWLLVILAQTAGAGRTQELGDSSETRYLYLSGTGVGDTVDWRFQIDRGRGAGPWTRIPVPSQWEQAGFGSYAYGQDEDREDRAEVGRYSYEFEAPDWRDRRVRLVFEGVMTDATVRVNGLSAGPTHRGGFTQFAFDVTEQLAYGESNLLEVEVAEASGDSSVNAAERDADYWVFGGIFRPVYLEAVPLRSVSHVAIAAGGDGELTVKLELSDVEGTERIVAQVRDPVSNRFTGPRLELKLAGEQSERGQRGEPREVTLEGRIPGIRPWSAERPNLYRLEIQLIDGDRRLHSRSVNFGFRTVEIRPGEGLFVNQRRVLLKGVNRHSFWPDSGRTLSPALNRRDVELLKSLNANAVRASHYPPDPAFLEACDELGLYVIDELPGWHDAYRAGVGSSLIREMVRRDVNHPSVILWANGNEGGWNSLLDAEFARHDLQARAVIHPGSVAAGIDATHYPSFAELEDSLETDSLVKRLFRWGAASPLVLPTEMLHALYDGGGGAGLEEYWRAVSASPLGAGGFLWALMDEGIVRTDLGGAIDTHGNYAPDGIVGPYRAPEASFQTVREIWSPIQIVTANWQKGQFDVWNRFARTDLSECSFRWQGLAVSGPAYGSEPKVLFEFETRGPKLAPGERGRLSLGQMPEVSFDALRLVAFDATRREVGEWVGWSRRQQSLLESWLPVEERVAARVISRPAWVESVVRVRPTRGAATEAELSTVWAELPSGWLRLEVEDRGVETSGFSVNFSDLEPSEIEWLGDGPWPVWANRLAGVRPGLWRRPLDDQMPGHTARGFYSDVRWMNLFAPDSSRRSITVVVESEELFVGVSSPRFPEDAGDARAELPELGTVSFLTEIPAMGTKFHSGAELRPEPDTDLPTTAEPWRHVIWLKFNSEGLGH